MDSKRERRPNVRLEELGDFPAAVACVVSPKSNANSVRKRRKPDFPINGVPENVSVSDDDPPGLAGSVSMPLPSSTLGTGLACSKSDETDTRKPELHFGLITRKSRLTNRRGRTAIGNSRVFAGGWGFMYSPETREEVMKEIVDTFRGTGCGRDEGCCVDGVSQWLEELGFGRYAGMFEIHEVDEEALPLLTIQDLKEIGVSAVGPRRQLFRAIQKVAGDQLSR